MTVSAQLISHRDLLTPSERQLLTTLLDDYPIIGLSSMSDLASAAGVSTTTVVRLLNKTGFDGFPQFQAALRHELKEMISDPIAKRDLWKTDIPEEHIISQYMRQGLKNLERSFDDLNMDDFDAFCDLLCDLDRTIFIIGGRITGTIAEYFYMHLQMIRPKVHLVRNSGAWPHTLLDLNDGDLVVAFDVRRYENTTLQMAQMCHERGAQICLFTDEWQSPVHRIATHSFAHRIGVPSAWDSMVPLLMLSECAIAAVQERLWETVKDRTDRLEMMFDQTKLFRKFT